MTEYDWSEQVLGRSESQCFSQVRGQVTTTGVQRNAGILVSRKGSLFLLLAKLFKGYSLYKGLPQDGLSRRARFSR